MVRQSQNTKGNISVVANSTEIVTDKPKDAITIKNLLAQSVEAAIKKTNMAGKVELKEFTLTRISDIERVVATQLRNIYRGLRDVSRRITDEGKQTEFNFSQRTDDLDQRFSKLDTEATDANSKLNGELSGLTSRVDKFKAWA